MSFPGILGIEEDIDEQGRPVGRVVFQGECGTRDLLDELVCEEQHPVTLQPHAHIELEIANPWYPIALGPAPEDREAHKRRKV